MLRWAPRSSDVRGVWIFRSGKVTCVSTAKSTLLNVSEFGGKPAPAFLTVVAGGGCGRSDPRAVPPTDRHVPQPGPPSGARASPSTSQPRADKTKQNTKKTAEPVSTASARHPDGNQPPTEAHQQSLLRPPPPKSAPFALRLRRE